MAIFRRPLASPARRDIWPLPDHPFELDCLRGVLPPGVLTAAAARAAKLGVGADRVLIQWGAISEEAYVTRLARHCDLTVEDFQTVTRWDCMLPGSQLRYAARSMLLPLRSARGVEYVQAPVGLGARYLAAFCRRFNRPPMRMRLSTQTALMRFLMRQPEFADEAADRLADTRPDLSANRSRRPPSKRAALRYLWGGLAVASAVLLAPAAIIQTCSAILAIWFLLFNGLRLAGAFAPCPRSQRPIRKSDGDLPVYTVMAALYREGRSVAALLRALERLDYPAEKLDIKIIIEADDQETRAALGTLTIPPHIHVIIAPAYGPRTKPKALNYALPFARGTFVAVFDAEDRPDPGQLRAALAAFENGVDNLACVQASLCIDNTADSWLSRMFTAEYAGQFDAFLQGFSQFALPLPLGGSSNHFRIEYLRRVGAWDPYNVTEDADLGIRLARYGYRTAMFHSTTYEEAPAKFSAWLRQRTRWIKGWMQTWIVHMRAPRRFLKESGFAGFAILNLLVGGNVLTGLAYPVLLGAVVLEAFAHIDSDSTLSPFSGTFAELHLTAIAAGCFSSVAVNVIGLMRRGILHEAWVLLWTPLYWCLLSVAAWRALFQLFRDPYRWEKTEHGLARHSRTMPHAARKLIRDIS
jgi:cellulose synthase/poly-beta-1,6-N-acetylglucosamine synthase-like glycosyltransferase